MVWFRMRGVPLCCYKVQAEREQELSCHQVVLDLPLAIASVGWVCLLLLYGSSSSARGGLSLGSNGATVTHHDLYCCGGGTSYVRAFPWGFWVTGVISSYQYPITREIGGDSLGPSPCQAVASRACCITFHISFSTCCKSSKVCQIADRAAIKAAVAGSGTSSDGLPNTVSNGDNFRVKGEHRTCMSAKGRRVTQPAPALKTN